ncbi:YqkE family protein [Cytobacillus spongiae]|uniref:YqkE family protein n=1 Tax=Cytobacillus spongiae TaxID=2901381 RepID=UPI001F48694E|nr:YqkE family protein [Cytobacillus spongiae]UII54720.1 YqkE family protein [Cytobacillus spongiae]
MKKQKRNVKQNNKKQEDKPLTLGDMLNKDLLDQLRETKKDLKEEAEKKLEEEEKRKREERRLREKNKSFEELLNESSMNWNDYK